MGVRWWQELGGGEGCGQTMGDIKEAESVGHGAWWTGWGVRERAEAASSF